jgi:hypothetical protein
LLQFPIRTSCNQNIITAKAYELGFKWKQETSIPFGYSGWKERVLHAIVNNTNIGFFSGSIAASLTGISTSFQLITKYVSDCMESQVVLKSLSSTFSHSSFFLISPFSQQVFPLVSNSIPAMTLKTICTPSASFGW